MKSPPSRVSLSPVIGAHRRLLEILWLQVRLHPVLLLAFILPNNNMTAASSDKQSQQDRLQVKNVHHLLSAPEKMLLFGHDSPDPVFEILHASDWTALDPRASGRKRWKRSSAGVEKTFPSKLTLDFEAFGETFKLILKRNPNLFTKNFRVQEEEASIISEMAVHGLNCFYQGSSALHPNSSAAISLCDGIRGLIETQTSNYVLNPLPERVMSESRKADLPNDSLTDSAAYDDVHVIVKRDPVTNFDCPYRKDLIRRNDSQTLFLMNAVSSVMSSASRLVRSRRSALKDPLKQKPTAVTVETAVFIDETLYDIMRKTFSGKAEQEIVTYVLTIMNAVQLLFKQSSLGREVLISVVLMDVLKLQPVDLVASDNIDTYLTNFCVWQHNKRINNRGLTPRWDHALLLSGINMYVVDANGRKKGHVVGLAPVSGMCNSLNSCTISEGTSFQTVLVAAHEMGHSLGMEHDGPQDGNACNADNFVMSPTLGSGKTTWSPCSQEYLEKFLQTPQSSCIRGGSSHVNILDQFHSSHKLPGQIFDASQQCALRFGPGSRKSHIQHDEDICRLLRCDTGPKRNTVVYHAHPALEGTRCGEKKGSCVPVEQRDDDRVLAETQNSISRDIEVIDGGWSAWDSWTECTAECVVKSAGDAAVGIVSSVRKCDNPEPRNSGKSCPGSDNRHRLCDAEKLCLSSKSYRTITTSDYINDVCLIAASRDENLEPRGTQYPSYDRSHSCYVWCHKKGGGFMTQGWKLPDGTPCGRETASHRPGSTSGGRYCISGECRNFDCDGLVTDTHVDSDSCSNSVDSDSLSSSSLSALTISVKNAPLPPPVTIWAPTTSCYQSCLENSQGVRLVTKSCRESRNCSERKESFQLCNRSDECVIPRETGEDYANSLCQKYRLKYPNLLSGTGRQISLRTGSADTACIVACQDRVWKDIHYQMDSFEDGKFPIGTTCRLADSPAHCVNGKCVSFDETGIPVDQSRGMYDFVKNYLAQRGHRYRRSATQYDPDEMHIVSFGHRLNQSTLYSNFWKPVLPLRPVRFEPPLGDSANSSSTLRLQTYTWAISLSDCSARCGQGMQVVRVTCRVGREEVDDSLCDRGTKPQQNEVRACNTHCIGFWRTEPWTSCSGSCGAGIRRRSVVCVHRNPETELYHLGSNLCSPEEKPREVELCKHPITCPIAGAHK